MRVASFQHVRLQKRPCTRKPICIIRPLTHVIQHLDDVPGGNPKAPVNYLQQLTLFCWDSCVAVEQPLGLVDGSRNHSQVGRSTIKGDLSSPLDLVVRR